MNRTIAPTLLKYLDDSFSCVKRVRSCVYPEDYLGTYIASQIRDSRGERIMCQEVLYVVTFETTTILRYTLLNWIAQKSRDFLKGIAIVMK